MAITENIQKKGKTIDHTDNLKKALEQMRTINATWFNIVVPAVNEYREAVKNGETPGLHSNSFPPEIIRLMDLPALTTGWIYERIETASKQRHNTTDCKIRKVLGYHTDLINDEPVKLEDK